MSSTTDQKLAASMPSRRFVLLVVAVGAAAGASLWILGGAGVGGAVLVPIATVGAVAVALLVPGRPVAAIGIVFLLAIFERLGIVTALGTFRMEQPAIIAMIGSVIWHRHQLALPALRQIWPLVAAGAVFVAVLGLSSGLVAVQPALSLRIVGWMLLSMLGGLVCALLLAGRVRAVFPWLVGAVCIFAVLGLLTAALYVLFGRWSPLVGGTDVAPRIFALAFEPNLYASLIASVVPLAVEQVRTRPSRLHFAELAVLLLALGLGVTRAAYIGLVVGLLLYAVVLVATGHTNGLRRVATVMVLAGLIGFVLPTFALNPPGQAISRPELVDPDTWDYRMVRVDAGLRDFQESPLIGLGAYSYGQRHVNEMGEMEVIAVLPVLVLHDAGLIGLAALAVFFLILAVRLWRASRDGPQQGPALALGVALVVLLVAYLATTALHFAVTWLLIGCAVAATLQRTENADPAR